MSKQLKLDLQRDQQKVRRYFERRIRDYSVHINWGRVKTKIRSH